MSFIKASVGFCGSNNFTDVKVVQWLLLRASAGAGFLGLLSSRELNETGIMDIPTQIAIKDFTSFANRTLSFLTLGGASGLSSGIIHPNDFYYNWLLYLVVQGDCFLVNVNMETNPLLKQARDGRISFRQFKQILKARGCEVLTAKGLECLALLKEPEILAFLDMIALAEGTDFDYSDGFSAGYTSHGGSRRKPDFTGVLHHPGGSAAGRYQAIPGTWKEAKRILGLTDITPESQDIFAVWKLKSRNMVDDIMNDRILDAIEKGSLEWASFPNRAKTAKANDGKPKSHYRYSRGTHKGESQPALKAEDLKSIYYDALKVRRAQR